MTKSVGTILRIATALLLTLPALAQMSQQQPAGAQTQNPQQGQAAAQSRDIYHISAFRAVPGRIRELRELLTRPAEPGQQDGFFILLRHQEGNEWDFMTIMHVGATATVRATAPGPQQQTGPSFAELAAWHGDTFASGPPLEEFRRNLRLTAGAQQAGQGAQGAQRNRAIYIVSDYAAAAGQRAQLQQTLQRIASERPNRSVMLTHVEGAPWTFLTITQYDSWMELAEFQENGPAGAAGQQARPAAQQNQAGEDANDLGVELRRSMSVHHDTIARVVHMGEPAAKR